MIITNNYSVGLRMHCADRKIAFRSQAKIPSPKAILHGFLPVTVRVLNSYYYNIYHNSLQSVFDGEKE